MKFIFSLFTILIFSCDFNYPDDNTLLDLNQPAVISEIAGMNVMVMDSNVVFDPTGGPNGNGAWVVADITGSSGWKANRGEFEISVKDRQDGRPGKYHLIFESRNPISLIGFDSIALNYNIDIYNLDDFYDNEVILSVGVKRIEFKIDGDDNYQPLLSINQILSISLQIRFRLYIILTSGIQSSIQTPTPYNEATYTINYGIYGFYK